VCACVFSRDWVTRHTNTHTQHTKQVAEKELKYFALVRTLLLPESSPAGRYELAMFQCSSKRGSAFSYDQHRMHAFGFPTVLQVGNPKVTPNPNLAEHTRFSTQTLCVSTLYPVFLQIRPVSAP